VEQTCHEAGTEHLLNSGAALHLAFNARKLPVAESLSYNVAMDPKGLQSIFLYLIPGSEPGESKLEY
jgi:hypothetical protein